MYFKCNCGAVCKVTEASFPLRCACGLRADTLDAKQIKQGSPPPRVRRDPGATGSASACLHRGPTLRLADCSSCVGKVELKVFSCKLHDECTHNKKLEGIACCAGCPDVRQPFQADRQAGKPDVRNAPPAPRLAVVTCYFNPVGFATRRQNFDRFYAAAASQGADLHVIEAREAGGRYELPDDLPNLTRVEFASRLWQKERLLNILIDALPRKYTQVAWVDCDVLFDHPDWVRETSELLERHQVVQLFETAAFLSRHGVPTRWWSDREGVTRISVAAKHGQEQSLGVVHPGLAWAGRREWLRKIGLWDRHIVGSGDSVMVHGFYGWTNKWHMGLTSAAVIESAAAWSRDAFRLIGGNVGCVPGLIRHLWHGDRKDRKYNDRLFYTRLADFDPAKHLTKNAAGCWEWSPTAPRQMVKQIAEYFATRKEDG